MSTEGRKVQDFPLKKIKISVSVKTEVYNRMFFSFCLLFVC